MKIQNVKGCNDYLPQEQKIRNYINDKLKETFKEFDKLSQKNEKNNIWYDISYRKSKFW